MNAVPFVDLTEGDGFWLSDLKPQGYLGNTTLSRNGVNGQFSVQILNTSGFAEAIYNWKHGSNKGTWKNDARWAAPSGADVVPHTVGSDLFLPMGTGLWTTAPATSKDDSTAVYAVSSAGGVCTNDVIWTLPAVAGAVAVANPYPVSIRLSSLKPTGYLDNTTLSRNGVNGQFSIQILNDKGFADAIYNWKHGSNKGTWKNDARWADPSGADVVTGGDNDLVILPGQGLWVTGPAHSKDDAEAVYMIEVKCPAF